MQIELPIAARAGLFAAVMVPLLYFGAQVLAVPFYPGYDFLIHSASLLGSDGSTLPQVLNLGAFLTGLAAIAGACRLHIGLRALGARFVLSWLVALCLVSVGAAALWASTFHLPDPRHNPGALGAGMFLVPFVMLAVVWRLRGHAASSATSSSTSWRLECLPPSWLD